jgi:hypothetical protein
VSRDEGGGRTGDVDFRVHDFLGSRKLLLSVPGCLSKEKSGDKEC